MTSPVDELTTPAPLGAEAPIPSHAVDEPAFGADEEHLVQLARQEAMLRLARAM